MQDFDEPNDRRNYGKQSNSRRQQVDDDEF